MCSVNEVGNFTRKMQKERDSYYVSLPMSWIKTNQLGKSDEVTISLMSDGSLRIIATKQGARVDAKN